VSLRRGESPLNGRFHHKVVARSPYEINWPAQGHQPQRRIKMTVHLIDEQWTLEKEWDSDWRSLYSGIRHHYDDQTSQIIREVCERYSNVRSQSEGCPKVIESCVIPPNEAPPHVLEKLIRLRFLRPESRTPTGSSRPSNDADVRRIESKDRFVVHE
jgi:hypothetical protein